MMLDGDSNSSTQVGDYLAIWGKYDSIPTTSSVSTTLNGHMYLGAPKGYRFYTAGGSEELRIDDSVVNATITPKLNTLINPDCLIGPNVSACGNTVPGWYCAFPNVGVNGAIDHHLNWAGGKPMFGSDSCCSPASYTYSINKWLRGNFHTAQNVEIRAQLFALGAGGWYDCGSGQEYVAEDDARIWIYEYNENGTFITSHYSYRASEAIANGYNTSGTVASSWADIYHSFTPNSDTHVIRIEYYFDDENGSCQSAGSRRSANAMGGASAMQVVTNCNWIDITTPDSYEYLHGKFW